ncbi:unnamed protein product [Heterobilharzia americana]|nr:unnamed protein product [Heterobilharzia americana]
MTVTSSLSDNAQLRMPWWQYYCTLREHQSTTSFISVLGFVNCPVCGNHLDNIKFFKHILSHLLVNEIAQGSLMSFEFCTECLSTPVDTTMEFHNRVHRHVEQHNPLKLMDGVPVCPICENCFTSVMKFAAHLYERHVHLDSPYVCTICYGFRSSYYCELISHLHNCHKKTNHIFCPYCLKHFELPVIGRIDSDLHTFDAHTFYVHVQQHWEQTTYRCDSCRLDFTHQRDLKWHEYLHHSGHPLAKPPSVNDMSEPLPNSPKGQLSICYSSQLLAHTPRMNLKCLECGERVRHPAHKHFSLTLHCTSCAYSTSCITAVDWHWNKVHCAPPIKQSSDHHETKSWQTCVVTSSNKPATMPTYSPSYFSYSCGNASTTQIRGPKSKHANPGLFDEGLIRCNCGFRTIVYDQMARHLAAEGGAHCFAKFVYGPRVTLFSIRNRPGKSLRTSLWWRQRLGQTPYTLSSVGLFQ